MLTKTESLLSRLSVGSYNYELNSLLKEAHRTLRRTIVERDTALRKLEAAEREIDELKSKLYRASWKARELI